MSHYEPRRGVNCSAGVSRELSCRFVDSRQTVVIPKKESLLQHRRGYVGLTQLGTRLLKRHGLIFTEFEINRISPAVNPCSNVSLSKKFARYSRM